MTPEMTEMPRTPTEERLARIWEEVLELPPRTVAVGSSFFALGGDSLRASQFVARYREMTGVEIELADLFEAPSLGALAERLSSAGALDGEAVAPLCRADRARPLPLSSPQKRLWFLDQLEPGNPAYNLALTVRLEGDLDGPALAAALAEIVSRHEALRTVFRVVEGLPVQLVLPAPSPAPGLPLVDLSSLAVSSCASAQLAAGLEREGARLPFDLARGPLWRVRLVRLAPGEHQLQLALHHIVSDGWSLGILLREIVALYCAFVRRQPSPLPDLPIQYGDFAVWQEGRLAGAAFAARLVAVKARLADAPRVFSLPADRPRPPVQSHRGAHATHALPAALVGGLSTLAEEHGASLFMALLAGFEALLYRWTAERDFVLGTAVANRPHSGLEGLIGFFVNTLPLRADLGGDPPFVALLHRVRGTVLPALAAREVPFERLVDELEPRRDLSRPALVQVMLVLQNAPLDLPSVPGLGLDAWEVDNGTARFDVALSVIATESGLQAVFKYSRDLFDAPTIDRLASHFAALLAGAVAEPGRRLSKLPLLSAPERHQVVVEWNATSATSATSAISAEGLDAGCLHTGIETRVDGAPESVALVYEDQILTYGELDRRANRLAHRLRGLGVGPDVVVGVAAERSLELVVGLLAVLKAGGAYLPLDPSYPADRLAFMIEDARLPLLLTQERLRGGLPQGQAQVLVLDGASLGSGIADRPATGVLADNLAYVIYTSGSTGRPKGSILAHRGIVNRLRWMQDAYGLQPGEGVLQKTPASFDVSVWEFFWPLLAGARLVLARPGGQQDTAYLTGLIARQGITTLHFVPSMLQAFLEEPRLADAAGLKRVIASGEALPRELVERFFARLGARLGGTELHNLYGPTEASVDVTAWACAREPDGRRGIPLGRPIDNLRLHLLDPAGFPVPIGVPGHLHIGGVGLARGYLRRPDLTAERFVPDPFSGAGCRLYATGDLARLATDGAIDYLGRLDHQVKIRGFRIELGEIEAALDAHPAVRESVVVAVRAEGAAGAGGANSQRLVAYVVGHGEEPPVVAELRASLRERLPEHMVPAAIVVLAAFPLTPSGKVDRKALPAPEAAPASEESATWVAPRTPLESRLAKLWAEQLKVPRIGVHDNFFALGGDSIQGALLVNRLQRELDSVVYVMALFDHPTVADLADHLAASYREALVAAGWMEATAERAPAVLAPDAAGETADVADVADVAALTAYLATRFSPSSPVSAEIPRNPRAIFLLSPFRSGSTLLRVMLAGHPGLFAPPELELLGFHTLGERRQLFAGRDSFAREGLLRAVMELRACDVEAAEALVAEAEERDEPIPAFYRRLQDWAGDRILVDKTPRYSLDRATLQRAESWFDEPLYVHLVRHPAATAHSYLEARMDEVYRFPLAPRRQAELVWRLAHENVLDFLAGVPASRQHRLAFEDLVRDPRGAVAALCRFLGLPEDPAMLSPYQGERMTDGVRREGRMMGDPKFHRHRQIEATVADRWQAAAGGAGGETCGEATWQLAERLGYVRPQAASPERRRSLPVIRPAGLAALRAEWPLAYAQERLWFIEQLDRSRSLYAMPGALRMRGALRPEVLAASLGEIVRRHATLRTRFVSRDGRPMQVVDPAWRPALPQVDLGALSPQIAEAELTRMMAMEQGSTFDLATGPLLLSTLVRVGEGDFVLLVTLHHIIADGWSIGLLLRELAAIYPACEHGRRSPLPELPVQYVDFAVWQRDWLSGQVLDEQLGYWTRQLASVPSLDLPADRPQAQGQVFRAGTHPIVLPAALVLRLSALGRGSSASPFMVLLAALQILLHRHSGQDDVAVGAPIAGRNRAEIEDLIGFFVNTLVLRTRFDRSPGFREVLGRVRAATLGAYEHQDLPFALLVETLRPGRQQGSMPLVEVMFTLQNQPPPQAELAGLDLALLPRADAGDANTQFSLVLNLREVRGELVGTLAYNSALFDRTTGARWRDHLVHLLKAVVDEPERPVAELPLLAASERHQVLVEWADARDSGDAGEILLPGNLPAGIGIWGERRGRRARRRADGSLYIAPLAGEPEGAVEAVPAPAPPERQPDAVAQARTDLANRRDHLSAAKRELLARRLRGQGSAGSVGSVGGVPPRPATPTILPEKTLDLNAETVLDPTIGPSPGLVPGVPAVPAARMDEMGAVLLTGATGFLGAYLVAELLRQTHADVLCLVRGASAAEATTRLLASLAEYGQWTAEAAGRVRAVAGDLARPLLGLSAARFAALASEVGAIYHNGAWVNVSYPYSALKAANVLGTQEILRLAFTGRWKPVHFVSTISIFFAPEYNQYPVVLEDDPLDHATGGAENGYAQSKWVGEKLVMTARERGLPAAIYRFGRATWHSRSGAWNPNDALRHVLESCLELGSFPEADANLDLAPVDYLAESIVALSLKSTAKAFHLLSPQKISWLDVIGWLRALGRPIEALPFPRWLAVAKDRASQASLPHLLRLGGLSMAETQDPGQPQFRGRTYDTRNVLAGLAGTGIVCPDFDAPLLQVFLARPSSTPAASVMPEAEPVVRRES
jgi:amino acid adenylation domain-containing protein/thioester reductase-like protein